MTPETQRNFLKLLSLKVIQPSIYILYSHYEVNSGKLLSLSKIAEETGLKSYNTIVTASNALRMMGLAEVVTSNKGRIVKVKSLCNETLKEILANDELLSNIHEAQDVRSSKFNPKAISFVEGKATFATTVLDPPSSKTRLIGYTIDAYPLLLEENSSLSRRSSKKKKLVDLDYYDSSNGPKEKREEKNAIQKVNIKNRLVDILVAIIPKEKQTFNLVPKYIKALESLEIELGSIDGYCRWFVAHKLNTGKVQMNLGIFTYPGIVQEYKEWRKKNKKVVSYKKISDKRAVFEKEAEGFHEEILRLTLKRK